MAAFKSNRVMKQIWRWYMLYCSAAFIVLIPVMYRLVAAHSLPKAILFFLLPAYFVMSIVFYKSFKALKPK